MATQDKIKREVLPIPDTPYMGLTTFTARDPDTHFPEYEPLRPPKGAPNVIVILLDDVGFGAASAFGGFTANDCLDIGQALGSPVSLDYREKAPFKFNGTIEQVHVEYLLPKSA